MSPSELQRTSPPPTTLAVKHALSSSRRHPKLGAVKYSTVCGDANTLLKAMLSHPYRHEFTRGSQPHFRFSSRPSTRSDHARPRPLTALQVMKFALALTIVVAGFAAQTEAFGCKPAEIVGWIQACDAASGAGRDAMCHDRQCHNALHRLVEQETRDCYVSSGMGSDASALDWYIKVDNFCHGDGQDPGEKPVVTTAPPTEAPTTTPTTDAPTTAPPTDIPTSAPPTEAPTTAPPANVTDAPTPTHPQC